MITLFTPSVNDQSLVYLAFIFKGMSKVINGQMSEQSMLGTMFSTFNSVALSVGALIVVYTIVVGVLKTAQEGEFLGKHWNSLWVPIRTVMGIAALIPSTTGYCAIQIVMMWIIVQGIGAADTVWNTALNYKGLVGSATAPPSIPESSVQLPMKALFAGLVCQATANVTEVDPNLPLTPSYYCAGKGDSCKKPTSFDGNNASVYEMGPGGACGRLSICDKNTACSGTGAQSAKCKSCQAQIDALATLIPGMAALAEELVKADYDYRMFYYYSYNQNTGYTTPAWIKSYCSDVTTPAGCCVKRPDKGDANTCASTFNFPSPNNSLQTGPSDGALKDIYWKYRLMPTLQKSGFNELNFIKEAMLEYTNKIIAGAQTPGGGQAGIDSNQIYQKARDVGWILAGSYYQIIAKTNNENLDAVMPRFDVPTPDVANADSQKNTLLNYRNNYGAANQLLIYASESQAQSGAGGGAGGGSGGRSLPSELGPIGDVMGSVGGDIMKSFTQTVMGTPDPKTGMVVDPLAKIQLLGRTLLIVIEVMFFVLLVVVIVLGILAHLNVQALGSGLTENPLGGALSQVYMWFVPMVLGFMTLFAAFGGLLAVYTPLIPYILFTFGAVGWFISVIEAMVAGPLVALGLIMPGGKDEVFGHAEGALMMLFGIFLRPSLMVFGMIAGMLLATVVVTMINAGFHFTMLSIVPNNQPSLLELVFFMAAYVGIVITALNKSFALIHIIPDRVLTWIGGQAGHTDHEGLEGAKGAVSAAGQGAGQGISAAGAKGEQKAGKIEGQKEDQQKELGRQADNKNSTLNTPPK